ncbi:MAG: hypothetical protein CHACPFDD_02025 [Phycisphaerae bacterium]|nr:hypothetical protein [Phycisphaerae bacterium]
MKHRQKLGVMLLALALPPGMALAATYSWIGQGADDDWDTCPRNWVVVGLGGCYPNDSADDASIPYNASGWTINLITLPDSETLDDLTIDSDVDFGSAGGSVTLRATTVVIAATNGESVVTVSGGGGMTTTNP